MPPITSTFEAFSSGQRHSRCVYSARKKTKLTRSPISNLRGDLGGSCGDREVLNLLQNLLLLPLLTCRLVGLEVKARIGILSPVKMKEMKFLNPPILNTFRWVCMRFIKTSNAICVRSWEARTYKKHPVAWRQFGNSSTIPGVSFATALCQFFDSWATACHWWLSSPLTLPQS